jgi:hypothetical protein
MSGRPKRIANIQSYVNRADVRSYGGNLKSGSGPSVGVVKNLAHNFSSRTHSKNYSYKFNMYRTPLYFVPGRGNSLGSNVYAGATGGGANFGTGPGKSSNAAWAGGPCPVNIPGCKDGAPYNWQPSRNFVILDPAYYRGLQ